MDAPLASDCPFPEEYAQLEEVLSSTPDYQPVCLHDFAPCGSYVRLKAVVTKACIALCDQDVLVCTWQPTWNYFLCMEVAC